jgi:hypothetical protein
MACGTTLEITQAFKRLSSSLCIAISCDSHTAYSSAVRLGSVADRHWAIQSPPS